MNQESPKTIERDESEEQITVELTEKECMAVQQALLTVCVWNKQDGCTGLWSLHNEVRKRFIDAHEEHLN